MKMFKKINSSEEIIQPLDYQCNISFDEKNTKHYTLKLIEDNDDKIAFTYNDLYSWRRTKI